MLSNAGAKHGLLTNLKENEQSAPYYLLVNNLFAFNIVKQFSVSNAAQILKVVIYKRRVLRCISLLTCNIQLVNLTDEI